MIAARYLSNIDIKFLLSACQYLHGYRLALSFHKYVVINNNNWMGLIYQGIIDQEGRPSINYSDSYNYLDFNSIDHETLNSLLEMCGVFYYVKTGHLKSNVLLNARPELKNILYLRGYDYEESHRIDKTYVDPGGKHQTFAIGTSTLDTDRFNRVVGTNFYPAFKVFKIISPRDIYWEIYPPEKYYGDFEKIIKKASEPILSIFLNAKNWKSYMEKIVDWMDYFIVYVSSVTQSVMWELELLKKKGRNKCAIIIYDKSAIRIKANSIDDEALLKTLGSKSKVWALKTHKIENISIDDFEKQLAQEFLVVSPEEFKSNIESYKQKISQTRKRKYNIGETEPIGFDFYPALPEEELERVYELDEELDQKITNQVLTNNIEHIMCFFYLIQLRIYTSLLLGKHLETGRVLAIYKAVMDFVMKYYFTESEKHQINSTQNDRKKENPRKEEFELARDHSDCSQYLSMTMFKSRDKYSVDPEGNAKYALEQFNNEYELATKALENLIN